MFCRLIGGVLRFSTGFAYGFLRGMWRGSKKGRR